jgi:putative FmdB family regulatory protein
MPFYDYKCTKCNTVFEIEKGMKETPKGLKCPKCKSPEVNRVFTKIRVLRGESALLNEHGTSGSNCNTCVDGECSSCKSKG